MAELHEALDDALAPRDLTLARLAEERDEKWRVDGERTADWALRRLASSRARMDRARAQAAEQIAIINEWLAGELEREQRDERFFVGKLAEWMRELEANGDTRKTVRYPSGTIKRRAGRTHLEVIDEDGLVAWLEDHLNEPERVLEYKTVIRKAELTKRFKSKVRDDVPGEYPLVDAETMEVLPGARIVRPEPTIDVETTSAPGPETLEDTETGSTPEARAQ